MKYNFFDNFINEIVAVACAAVTISACEKAPSAETIDSKITVESKVLTVEAAEGSFAVNYGIEGAAQGGEAEVSFDSEWLSLYVEPAGDDSGDKAGETAAVETGTKSDRFVLTKTVRLAVAENDSESSRAGKVTLSIKGAEPVSISVIQKANPDYVVNNQVSFTLDAVDATETTVVFTVAPNIDDVYYYYGFFPAKDYDSFASGEEFVKSTVSDMKAYADRYEQELGTKFNLKNYLFKGYRSTTQSSLDPATDYCLVAFDLTPGWGYSGKVAVHRFKTAAIPASSSSFELSYDKSKGIAWVDPTESASGRFSFGIAPRSVFESYKAPSVLVSNFVENQGSALPLYSVSDGGRGLPLYQYSDIEPGTEYVLFAFLYNNSRATDIAWLEFQYVKP